MREINIGQVLVEHRRKRGVTQEELAEHIGVSKTAVSKWETATTYPDIALLPRLAAFFHITIDQLMGYRPQMEKEEIRKLHQSLTQEFGSAPFSEVMDRCREIAKRYFACPELLFQLACLYVNHCALAGELSRSLAVIEEAMALFIRVKEESSDGFLVSQAVNMEGFCLLRLGRTQEAVQLLKETVSLHMAPECLLAEAYQMAGNQKEARRTLQAGMYQTVLEVMNLMLSYLAMCQESPEAFAETARRIQALEACFRLNALHPGFMLSVYLSLAQGYMAQGQEERALDMLEQYKGLALSDIDLLRLHGDDYFTLLDGWLEENLTLGRNLPRHETAIRKSVLDSLAGLPAFAGLKKNPRFQEILRKIEHDRRYAI